VVVVAIDSLERQHLWGLPTVQGWWAIARRTRPLPHTRDQQSLARGSTKALGAENYVEKSQHLPSRLTRRICATTIRICT